MNIKKDSMAHYNNILTHFHRGVFTITLNREHKRNAIDEQTMDELLDAIREIPAIDGVRLAVIRGKGRDFCAGADLDWMRNTQDMSREQLAGENMKLQKVFELWFDLPVFTMAVVHGNVVGGAIGLVAASDLVIASAESRFRFSEVTLGLIPATISPFVLQRTRSRFIRNAMLTAMPFSTDKALEHGLVDEVIDHAQDQSVIDDYLEALNKTGAGAVSGTKKLCNDLIFNRIEEPLDSYTTALLASVRTSEEAVKRIAGFFQSIEKKG